MYGTTAVKMIKPKRASLVNCLDVSLGAGALLGAAAADAADPVTAADGTADAAADVAGMTAGAGVDGVELLGGARGPVPVPVPAVGF